jgi:hypothetical protein
MSNSNSRRAWAQPAFAAKASNRNANGRRSSMPSEARRIFGRSEIRRGRVENDGNGRVRAVPDAFTREVFATLHRRVNPGRLTGSMRFVRSHRRARGTAPPRLDRSRGSRVEGRRRRAHYARVPTGDAPSASSSSSATSSQPASPSRDSVSDQPVRPIRIRALRDIVGRRRICAYARRAASDGGRGFRGVGIPC